MDFTAIWDKVSPYINVSLITTIGTAIAVALVKMFAAIRQVKGSTKELDTKLVEMFSKAMPKDLALSVKSLTAKELTNALEKIIPEIKAANEISFALLVDVARALIELKTMPEAAKALLRRHLEKPIEIAAEPLRLEMNLDFEEISKEVSKNKTNNYLE